MDMTIPLHSTLPACILLVLVASASAQTTYYVSPDGKCGGNTPCFSTIQEAYAPAVDGDEIVIAPGTYAPFSVAGKVVTIRSSDGREVTIIDGGAVEACVLNFGSGSTTFEGLTFTNGVGQNFNGGAIGIAFGSPSFTFNNCVFSNSSSIKGAIGTPTVTDGYTFAGCTFSGNSGDNAGVLRTFSGPYVFVDCTFSNNTATQVGGALSIQEPMISITGCTFQGNSAPTGGAIGNAADFSGPNAQLDDCVFDGNTATGADGGGAIWTYNSIPITNCQFMGNIAEAGPGGAVHSTGASGVVILTDSTFDQNEAVNGGGVSLYGGSATGCTFTGNIASGNGGAVHAASGESTIVNCEMSMNAAGTSGGGVYVADLAIVNISDSTLCLNTPDQFAYVGALLATNVFGCDVTCPDSNPVGACCLPQGGCAALSEANCIAIGGTYQGDGVSCDDLTCAPPCLGDLNGDCVVDGLDLAILLGNWG